jgi:hypothetical protein
LIYKFANQRLHKDREDHAACEPRRSVIGNIHVSV